MNQNEQISSDKKIAEIKMILMEPIIETKKIKKYHLLETLPEQVIINYLDQLNRIREIIIK